MKTPEDSIRRYKMILQQVKNGCSKQQAYTKYGVDRNTIAPQAPIAELASANPEVYAMLKASFKRKDSIKVFASTCRGFCKKEPTASAILLKKQNGTLLDIFQNE